MTRSLGLLLALIVALGCEPRHVEGPRDVKDTQVEQTGFIVDAFVPRMPALRRHVAAVLGLDPLPARTPLAVKSFGVLDSPDFTLEKLEFTSRPGFPVTAHFYLPKKRAGRIPAVLQLHGHWPGGKSSEQVRMRSAQLARMGIASLAIDCYGSPGPGNERGHLGGHYPNDDLAEGVSGYLFATGVSIAGIAAWDAIRALDYLRTRPEVDPTRIATAGASFGATQSLLAAILDDRVAAVAGVCYGSAFTRFPATNSCEQIAGLRKNLTNQELLSLPAPRPLFLLQHYKDQPFIHQTIERVYGKLGAVERFTYEELPGTHDFDRPKREAFYRWIGKTFLGVDRAVTENGNYPFRPDELFCHPEHRVGPEALSVTDLFAEVERNAGAGLVVPKNAAQWAKERKAFVARLTRAIGYDPNSLDMLIDPGAGSSIVGSAGTAKTAVVRVVSESVAREDRAPIAGEAVAIVRLDGVERAVHAAKEDWDLSGKTPAQVRYGANVIGILYGEPHLYRKIQVIKRAAERLSRESGVPPDRVRLEAGGDEANILLLTAVLEPDLSGSLVLRNPLLSYIRRGDNYPRIEITPPSILTVADVPDLIALLAPRPVTITGGHLADGTKADASLLAKAVRTYATLGASAALEVKP
jgi:dienelactone hydrolase